MIKSAKELITKAYQNHYSVPAINVSEIDMIFALFNACRDLSSPVIIQIAPIQILNRPFGYKELIQIINLVGSFYEVDYAIHLDHAEDINEIEKAIECGFTSIMFDGSHQTFDENIKNTNLARMKIDKNISLEAELGVLGVKEGGYGENSQQIYTDIDEAKIFVKSTSIDMLAVAIGNSHGVYLEKPQLNIDLLKELNKELQIPLVLHGASGLSKEDIDHAIKNGVAKINFFTDIDYSYTNAFRDKLREEQIYTFSYMQNVYKNIENEIREKIMMCRSEGKL